MPEDASDLQAMALKYNVSVETLWILAAISDPKNAHRFSIEAARKAFAHIKLPPEYDAPD